MAQTTYLRTLANPDSVGLRLGFAEISAELIAGTLRPSPTERVDTQTTFLESVRAALNAAPRTSWPRLAIAFNDDQIESKLWLVERVDDAIDLSGRRVVILGAWYGVLALVMDRLLAHRPADVQCIDIDEESCAVAAGLTAILSSHPQVICADMMTLDYEHILSERETVFINTSCEHLPDFPEWRARLPTGARVVLQSNNHRGCSEHVSCVPDVDVFEQESRLSEVDYRGTLPLRIFNRFMLIGRT